MASQTAEEDRLDALDREIDDLEAKLLDAQRTAGDLAGDEQACELAEAQVMILRARVDFRLRLSRRLNRAFRKSKCAAHGDALIAACPECRIAWRYQPSRVA